MKNEKLQNKKIFKKVGATWIIPISAKILFIFSVLLLASNFSTNFITILLFRNETMDTMNTLLIRDMKEFYSNAGDQFQIMQYSNDKESAFRSLVAGAENNFTYPQSWVAGVQKNGDILFGSESLGTGAFPDTASLQEMLNGYENGITEGARFFHTRGKGEYFGIYKYHDDWNVFLIRAVLMSEMMKKTNKVFVIVSIIIVTLSILFVVVGFFAITKILRYVHVISDALFKMQSHKTMELIDMSGAPNDDIAYLGISFNGLASTINNLLTIFRKFTTKDIVTKVYADKNISLEGTQRELTVLFSDIRGFTHMTEVLGNDIIELLNLHYDKAIREIHNENGIIGSIIGDALLAVYGAIDSAKNKSLEALNSGWAMHDAVNLLRSTLIENRKKTESEHTLSDEEKNYFDAIMIDIGVGIDGGTVFYGTIGSYERMTNTVIGDNVNSSSRLEGLTRLYNLPIIVSDYVKDEVLQSSDRYKFFEVDTVMVKGKTQGKKIWYPLDTQRADQDEIDEWTIFSQGLDLYYKGEWESAYGYFSKINHALGKLFLSRIESSNNKKPPIGWNGIWTMEIK
ncbi:MAG: hypothetical protein Ta2F_16290 [Termitinemataceae bacterium]|nr:MAG: hypothetical protein Ta2F_16290 [Termitinemataceae bacterium]